jgi:hypothetical protein
MWFKKLLRRWTIVWEVKTARWVVPGIVWMLIDNEQFYGAGKFLDEAAKTWGEDDPEITRARSLSHFLEE